MDLIFVLEKEISFIKNQKSASLDLRALYYMYKITRYLLTLSSSLHLYHLCVFCVLDFLRRPWYEHYR